MSHINSLRNQFRFKGNLGKDPEATYTPGGVMVLKFSVAVRMSKWDSETKTSDWGTEWFDVTMFGKQAENFNRLARKGTFVEIAGELTWNKWVANDGTNRKTLNIIAEAFDILKNGVQGEDSDSAATESSGSGYVPEDDIPF